MKLALVIGFFSALCFAISATLAVSLSKPNCQEKCGHVAIPYPFGIGDKCSADSAFTVICKNYTKDPPKPFLSGINLEILNISLHGIVIVDLPVSPLNCSDVLRTESVPISLKGGPFSISAHYNSLVVMGCKNLVLLRTNTTSVGGCMAMCDADSTNTSCNGVNCCQTSIPTRLKEMQYTYQSSETSNNSSLCGYIFPADKKWLQNKGYKRYKGLVSDMSNPFDRKFGFAPLVLEWEFDITTKISYSICIHPHDFHLTYPYGGPYGDGPYGYSETEYLDNFCSENRPDDYRLCLSLLSNYENEYLLSNYENVDLFYYSKYEYVSSRRYCSCMSGFEGNPYIHKGCSDIDECRNARLNDCIGYTSTCVNTNGSFVCDFNRDDRQSYGYEYYQDYHHHDRF